MIHSGQIIIILYKDCVITPIFGSILHTNSSWIDFDLKTHDHGCLAFGDTFLL